MDIESTQLYTELKRRAAEIPAGPSGILQALESLREAIRDTEKYIALSFPEYTPHDDLRHLASLFSLADRVLGKSLFDRLSPTELVLFAFALYSHDWGMAVSDSERQALEGKAASAGTPLLPNEPLHSVTFFSESANAGTPNEEAWSSYLRTTHGLRSGARLRKHLEPLGALFAETAAKIAEGHTLELREIRDTERYSWTVSVWGDVVNVAALANYVRIIDLLDIGDDRTPYALWKFVAPSNLTSRMEWEKHRALSPASVREIPGGRKVLISGHTSDPAVFAALADLRRWVDEQFTAALGQIRGMPAKYGPGLDSLIEWKIDAAGFEPLMARFDCDRSQVLTLLSSELFRHDPLAFIRELLQNSVDAIDIRQALNAKHGLTLNGEIRIRITSEPSEIHMEWSDNGIGMDANLLTSYFASVGKSWYRSREAGRTGSIEAISQFGVGVLSYFAASPSLTMETRKDPSSGGNPAGLRVEIPSIQSHFRIRTTSAIPVGTTISLRISTGADRGISKRSIIEGIARTARFVRHRITLEADGIVTLLGAQGENTRQSDKETPTSDASTSLLALRGNSAQIIEEATNRIDFEFGNIAGEFNGQYSAFIPKDPDAAESDTDSSVWIIGGKSVELDDVLVESEQALYVKGIRVGPVKGRRHSHFSDGELPTGSRYSTWLRPNVQVNIRHPSYLRFNLERSSVDVVSTEWIDRVWREIATKIRDKAFTGPIVTPSDWASLLGTVALFGGVPDKGLDALAEPITKTPLLYLRSDGTLQWAFLEELTGADELTEAPFELGYVSRNSRLKIGDPPWLPGWVGGNALFPKEGATSNEYPFLQLLLEYGHQKLDQLGWRPVRLQLVRGPEGEPVPLVCRVWRRVEKDAIKDPLGAELDWTSLRKVYREAPELLSFPEEVGGYAAIGSRFWNISHPKAAGIASALMGLAERRRKQLMEPERARIMNYLADVKFLGYVVPSRYSGKTLGIEAPNRLLELASEEGLSAKDRLAPSDFYPGTLGKYGNPYHYDLRSWRIPGGRVGAPWHHTQPTPS